MIWQCILTILNLLKKRYIELIVVFILYIGLRFGGAYGFYINGDGKGYYAYLPSVFIYHDYTFSFINKMDEKYYPEGARADFRTPMKDKLINRYFIGASVLWLPFFLIAHLLSFIFGFPTDGYSTIYQYSILFAAVFYLWIGLLYLRRLLLSFRFSGLSIIGISVAILFASPLIFYTIINPDWSHLYSFTFITAFLYYIRRYSTTYHPKYLLFSFLCLGLIVIIRPVNGIVVLSIPFITGSLFKTGRLIASSLSQIRFLIIGILIFMSFIFIQLLFYKAETGQWLIYSYTEYGFNFLKPHFLEVLAGYRKGIFIYTPLIFLSLLGFIKLLARNPFMSTYLFFFLTLVVYLLSSWECWGYGMCFGYRPITEYLPFFALLLGFAFQLRIPLVMRICYYTLIIFTIVYNSILLYQYKNYILHWDNMNKESYWKVFMRTGPEYRGILWTDNYSITKNRPNVNSDTIYLRNFEEETGKYNSDSGYFSHKATKINKGCGNTYTDSIKIDSFTTHDSVLFYISAYIRPLRIVKNNSLQWTLIFKDSISAIEESKKTLHILPFRMNSWYYISQVLAVKKPISNKGLLKYKLENKGKQKFLIDNIIIEQMNL